MGRKITGGRVATVRRRSRKVPHAGDRPVFEDPRLARHRELMLHDIRNFCTAQILITERLLRGAETNLTPAQVGLLKRAGRQAQFMHRTVEDLRVLARLKERCASGTGRCDRLGEIFQRILVMVRALHFDRPFEASVECPVDLETADAPLMESIFTNLIENAVRHTARELKPKVDVHVAAAGAKATFVVRGGTPPDKRVLAHLFERYVKGPESKGAGLGLALVREIVEKAGGRIAARLATAAEGPIFEVTVSLPNRPPLLAVRSR